MPGKDLISTEELAGLLGVNNLVVVDCRFELLKPEQGYNDYLDGHIPGAFYANLDKDLASPKTPTSGRHPLPDASTFAALLAQWGVQENSKIVVYDNAGGSIAVRLWWLLNYFGVNQAAVLDGGINQWIQEGRPINNHPVELKTQIPLFKLIPNPEMLVSIDEMVKIASSKDYLLIDARTADRYFGKVEPIDTVAGHIPGAVNRFHASNLNYKGLMKSPEKLRQEYLSLINQYPYKKVVVYCGSGVTSCHLILGMKLAGIEGPRLYAGSWSEWIRDPQRPIETV